MNIDGFEIERKYLIRMPDPAFLAAHAAPSQIEQTYLRRPAPQVNARVRKRGREGAAHKLARQVLGLVMFLRKTYSQDAGVV